MNSILWLIVVVLCLIEGCVCPHSYRDPHPVSRYADSRSDPIIASSDPSTWRVFEPTVNNLLAAPRPLSIDHPQPWYNAQIMQPRATISLQPKNPVEPMPFYDRKLLRSKSNLNWPEQPKFPNLDNQSLVHADREWFQRQNFNDDPLITAKDDFMVDLVRVVYKNRVILIVISDFYDPVGHRFLQKLIKEQYTDLIVVRAYFSICPETKLFFEVSIYSPTFVILSNGIWLYKCYQLVDLKAKLNEVYNLRVGKTQFAPLLPLKQKQSSFPLLQPPPSREEKEWWWTKKESEPVVQRQLSLPAQASTSQRPNQLNRMKSYPPMAGQLGSLSETPSIQTAINDQHFMDLLLTADPWKCILVEITNEHVDFEGDVLLYLSILPIRFKRIMIIRAHYLNCSITADMFKVQTHFPSFVLFESDRSKEEHTIYGHNGYNDNLKARLEIELNQYCK